MSGVATAIAASAVIGGIASNRAASKQAKAAQKGIDAQNALLGPYAMQGQQGLGAVQSFVDNGANFADTQAYKDITNASRAGGQFGSGNRATALTDYYATNFRPQRLNELMQLPTLGANAAAGQASNLGNLYGAQGNAQAQGIYGMGLAAQNALGSYAYLQNYKGSTGQNSLYKNTSVGGYTDSDIRLKTNVKKVGEMGGINIYTWDWKKGGSGFGVIAQEVNQEYVREKDGYLQVNYSGLFGE
jgi:hypothetical protein